MQTKYGQHRSQQRVLILAVAVLVFEHFRGMMRLISSNAEGHADVANLSCNISVDSSNLLFFAGFPRSDLCDFGLNLGIGSNAIDLQAAIPFTYRLPALEGAPRNIRECSLFLIQLLFVGQNVL